MIRVISTFFVSAVLVTLSFPGEIEAKPCPINRPFPARLRCICPPGARLIHQGQTYICKRSQFQKPRISPLRSLKSSAKGSADIKKTQKMQQPCPVVKTPRCNANQTLLKSAYRHGLSQCWRYICMTTKTCPVTKPLNCPPGWKKKREAYTSQGLRCWKESCLQPVCPPITMPKCRTELRYQPKQETYQHYGRTCYRYRCVQQPCPLVQVPPCARGCFRTWTIRAGCRYPGICKCINQ